MAQTKLPAPTRTISKNHARRFLLAHHRLWPPRKLRGKEGLLEYIRHVGSIQYDPINVVGRNPDLVLQSRVANYRPTLLEELLYHERKLIDGFDKMAAIHLTEDRPYFARHRAKMQTWHGKDDSPAWQATSLVRAAIQQRGPLSSIDIKHDVKLDWSWGVETRLVRAAMEILAAMGELGVHHKVGTRRVFDLAERLLPPELVAAPDPNQTEEAYQDWHVLRRLGGLGLAVSRTSEFWYGIVGVKTAQRNASLKRLVEQGEALALTVEGVEKHTLFMRRADLPALEAVQRGRQPKRQAAFIAPLDNLIWDRQLIGQVFDFDYIWEVYKPKAQRKYGYYVLPVLYGDRFVARFLPAFDKQTRALSITGWWWESGVAPDDAMQAALQRSMRQFMNYLDVAKISLGEHLAKEKSLGWVTDLS